jgi:hypothetical protein
MSWFDQLAAGVATALVLYFLWSFLSGFTPRQLGAFRCFTLVYAPIVLMALFSVIKVLAANGLSSMPPLEVESFWYCAAVHTVALIVSAFMWHLRAASVPCEPLCETSSLHGDVRKGA